MISSSQFEAAGPFSQSSEPSSAAKSRGTEGLVPVTVKQLSEAYQSGDEKSNFQIDGADVTNVTIVGMVDLKVARVTDVSFSLDDGTGRVSCRRWINEGFESREMEDIQDGMYVRVVGHLRGSQGGKQVAAFSVRPVVNFDEITFHFIDVIHQHLQKSRSKGDASSQHESVDDSTTSLGNGSAPSGHTTASSSDISGQYAVSGVKSCDQKVIEYLQQNFSIEKGIHRDEISRQLKIPVDKIMDSIRTLEDEGLVYSTIDEYHYKSTTES